jgi:catechol 2,3-dioxygenase-like lactoylglutathione lyase family enzyme
MLAFASIVPVLRVADVARSVAWYREILGFAAEWSSETVPVLACRLRRDGAELMIRRSTTPPAPRMPTHGDWDVLIRLRGESLVALLDQARRRTPLVRGPERLPDGNVEFELEDPDGHRVCVAEVLSDTQGIPNAIS